MSFVDRCANRAWTCSTWSSVSGPAVPSTRVQNRSSAIAPGGEDGSTGPVGSEVGEGTSTCQGSVVGDSAGAVVGTAVPPAGSEPASSGGDPVQATNARTTVVIAAARAEWRRGRMRARPAEDHGDA